MRRMTLIRGLLLVTTVILMSGCESRDEQLADYAQQATQQQARQNEAMAKQSQELASAAHELVEQDATARREMIQAHERVQDQLQEQQAGLDQQRQVLHVERKEAAQAAVRDPIIAEALIVTGLILATLLPLIVTAYALHRLPDHSPTEALLANALLDELATLPTGLPGPGQTSALPPNVSAPRLPGPGEATDPAVAPVIPAT